MSVLNVESNDVNTSMVSSWSSVLVMSLCCAVLIASEFMPVSLLTPIAFDLKMSEGLVGQAIAISGVFAVVTSLTITTITRKWDRRTVIIGLTLLMIVSGVIITFAHSALLFMLGRAMLGIVIGGFWSMSTAIIMRLVLSNDVPKALGLLNGGNALATSIAAPAGSYLGAMIGWRGAFFCIVPIALIALVWQIKSMPQLPPLSTQKQTGNVFVLLKRPTVLLGMLGIMFLFMGQFALFAYLRPFLEKVTLVDTTLLSSLLLLLGVSGLIGTYLISHLLQQHLYRYLVLIPSSLAILALGLFSFGHTLWLVAIIMGLWGLVATPAPVAWSTWLTKTLPQDAEAGGGLMVAIIQLAITLGATIGGLLFDWQGYQATFILSALILVVSAVSVLITQHIQTI